MGAAVRGRVMRGQLNGEARRIDLHLRAIHPYLITRIFRLDEFHYVIFIKQPVDDFESLSNEFDRNIRHITVPITITTTLPKSYEEELNCIGDSEIPSNFEGVVMTHSDLISHMFHFHPDIGIESMTVDHKIQSITVNVLRETSSENILHLQATLDALVYPFRFVISCTGETEKEIPVKDGVFSIAPAKSKQQLNAKYLEREERLWFDNLEGIYSGNFLKNDLFFFDNDKSSCLVNCSVFSNTNLRNHLLLYDEIYCILPLVTEMEAFLEDQKITKDELLFLVEKGRLKILNFQPEGRMDYGFFNEVYETNNNALISRLAVSALCATDLVEINRNYIFNDPMMPDVLLPALEALSETFGISHQSLVNFIYWPKAALRTSFETLSRTGPMGIAQYGVNSQVANIFANLDKEVIEFELTVNSSQIHIAHALNATYFPFFTKSGEYTDHPYAHVMGSLLNFYQSGSMPNLSLRNIQSENSTMNLINTFEIDKYIPIPEFEADTSSSNVRVNVSALFTELNKLGDGERNEKIALYNDQVNEIVKSYGRSETWLDLNLSGVGVLVPYLDAVLKLTYMGGKKLQNKSPKIQALSEVIEAKLLSEDKDERYISILSKINRVARLKRDYR
ncbi:MAG: hypothetical protein OQK24_02280 [Magnetovibrio sp.]|nr:hypothetical protein [Magnetovibrio sp.]